jgi:AraC family transcriptional regulator of adaptative response/methylated-DNA-[protein]-cysteine methyltransferase
MQRGASLSGDDYARMARVIGWMAAHHQAQPSVGEVAAVAGLSEAHFSRLFRRWAGISPRRYIAELTLGDAKAALRSSSSVEAAAWDSGLSGPGRLHDLFVSLEAMTPGQYRARGRGLELGFGFGATPFGDAMMVRSERGIVALRFVTGRGRDEDIAALRDAWPHAMLEPDAGIAQAIGELFSPVAPRGGVRLAPPGTAFQHQVWRALLDLASGAATSYGDIARAVGRPGASRAVGSAVGANPVAWLIPCHRVLRASGELGGYRWGQDRKRMMLAWERCHTAARG